MLCSRAVWSGVVVLWLALALPVPGQSESGPETGRGGSAAETPDVVDELAVANQLIAFGRGELAELTGLKEVKSPEALVAAGGILLRIHKKTGGKSLPLKAEIINDEGEVVAEEEGISSSLEEDAEALFDEARAMGGANSKGIEAAIRQAKLVPERGAVGGPRTIARRIASGKVHTVKINFDSGALAKVHMQGTGVTQFEVVGEGGRTLWHSRGNWGFYHWTPSGRNSRTITVKVINKGGPAVAYTIRTN